MKSYAFLWFASERDAHAVPEIDHADDGGEVHEFFIGEMLFHFGINFIGRTGFGHVSDGFRPGEGGAFAIGEKRRFPPRSQAIEPLLRFAQVPGFGGVHIEAKSAAIDLRNPYIDERAQFCIGKNCGKVFVDFQKRLVGVRSRGAISNSN